MENKVLDLARGLITSLQDYFFPKNCLNCGEEGSWLCKSCKDSLFFIDGRSCPFCKKIVLAFDLCDSCKNKSNIFQVFSLFKYNDFLARRIIKTLKYRFIKDIAQDIAPIIRKFLIKYESLFALSGDEVLIPVPLHTLKYRQRGFNQAEIIADIVANAFNLKVENNCIIKSKITKNQAELDFEKRYYNLRSSFKLIGKAPKQAIIVDDVFTTGSTVREIAHILHLAGTEKIQVITLARG